MLDVNHPGFHDPEYRLRRDQIAIAARSYSYPDPVPYVEYDEKEHEAWQQINSMLWPIHDLKACDLYMRMRASAFLDARRIPQLEEINTRLIKRTGFRLSPIDGLVNSRVFLSALADRRMLCTQYIRHHTVPLYTPEPDVVHELIGHAVMFFDLDYCRLNVEIGEAARVLSDSSLVKLERLYWYSIEFGLVMDRGITKAFGAGLLSSAGEMAGIDRAVHAPFLTSDIMHAPYDTTRIQKILYKARSLDEMYHEILKCVRRLREIENV